MYSLVVAIIRPKLESNRFLNIRNMPKLKAPTPCKTAYTFLDYITQICNQDVQLQLREQDIKFHPDQLKVREKMKAIRFAFRWPCDPQHWKWCWMVEVSGADNHDRYGEKKNKKKKTTLVEQLARRVER